MSDKSLDMPALTAQPDQQGFKAAAAEAYDPKSASLGGEKTGGMESSPGRSVIEGTTIIFNLKDDQGKTVTESPAATSGTKAIVEYGSDNKK